MAFDTDVPSLLSAQQIQRHFESNRGRHLSQTLDDRNHTSSDQKLDEMREDLKKAHEKIDLLTVTILSRLDAVLLTTAPLHHPPVTTTQHDNQDIVSAGLPSGIGTSSIRLVSATHAPHVRQTTTLLSTG